MDFLSNFSCDVNVAGDFNVHIERCHDPHTLRDLLLPLIPITMWILLRTILAAHWTLCSHDHDLKLHIFADDVQIYASCAPADSSALSLRMSLCLDDLLDWCSSHRLALNPEKSQFLWCSSRQRRASIPSHPVRVGHVFVSPSACVRVLGVHMDSHLSFEVHVSRCLSSCFSMLRQIRSIKRSLTRPILVMVVTSLVLSRLDYCISVLGGISKLQIKRLQSILNASARLIFSSSRFSSVSPYLDSLNFLSVSSRIDFRLAILVHNCLQNKAPLTCLPSFRSFQISRHVPDFAQLHLRSLFSPALATQHSEADRFLLALPEFGTLYPLP